MKQNINDIANDADHTLIPSSVVQQLKSWDIWHHYFGHIGYSGLKKLFDHKLVTGFFVDHNSQMADCVPYTEAKQSVIPFNKKGEWETELGEIMHINVWGKYDTASINGFYYYLLMVDDMSQYVTVEFMKTKDQAMQKVKNYLTQLQTHGKIPKAIHINHRCEFINASLLEWLYSKGMKVHMTVPHSPSQNGVTE